jgi:eukaryotic-like serine/threonine-protein kinase
MAADRHLLFGLLALQNGIVHQGHLVAAFQAWSLDRSKSLADHLIARGDLDSEQREVVDALVALHLKKHGDVERSLAAVPAGRSNCENLARLADTDVAASLRHLGAASTDVDDDADRTASCGVGTSTSDGQRFRVLRPHARGGLGAVFVALDSELHREVALKQILDRHADDPASRRRFLAEAEITGGLEHPGIVPVYGLGTYADGRPYYAMRFIRGDSLKDAIERFHGDEAMKKDHVRRSLELRMLLRRFTDVCNAIEYAHSRGVLHRDIKPGNIIVGKHGETLVVDWGLAKAVGRADPSAGERTIAPSSSGSSETLPGSALGTPGYMSPEQARGDLGQLGPQSDVYGLGATLYCLLTGRPPFEGDDAGAVLGAVEEGDFARPTRLDPSLDPAIEAVCLKAMALRPEDRYASPRLLAEDVERCMAGEPVSAWHEPVSRRLARWLDRHRTGVVGTAEAVLAGVVGLIAVLAVQATANARLSGSLKREKDANIALAAAYADLETSRAAVQARYDLAARAIRALHTAVTEDVVLKEGRYLALRNRLLTSASDFYVKLSALLGRETDVASRRALVQSNFELAGLMSEVGRKEDALAAHRAVLAAREALAAEPGADAGLQVDVGRSLTEVASLLDATGKTAEALAGYRRAESLLTGLVGPDPAARAALAACRSRTAWLLLYANRHAEALASQERARADQVALAAAPGASIEARRDLAETLDRIGFVLFDSGRPAEAEAELRTALAIARKLADEDPAAIEPRRLLAGGRLYLGRALPLTGRLAEAEAEFRAALAIEQALADENPAVGLFRRNVARGRTLLSVLLAMTGRVAEAEAGCRTALAILRKVAEENPTVPEFRSVLGLSHATLGQLLLQKGEPVAAEAECRTALAIEQKVVEDNPTVVEFRRRLAYALDFLGDVDRSLGRPAEAEGLYDREIAVREPLVRENPTNLEQRYWLVCAIRRRGLARRDLNDSAGAAADTRRALALCNGLPPRSGRDLFETACCHAALARLAGRAASGVSADEAEIEAARAMESLVRAVAAGYRNANEIRIESALEPLRSRDDFRRLMSDLDFPAEPFARAE